MTRVLLLLISAGLALGQPRHSWPFTIMENAVTTASLNSAATGGYSASWIDFGFVPAYSKTLSKVRFHVQSVTGTLTTSDVCLALYNDGGNGDPGTVIETRCTVTSTPTGTAWVEVTGFTSAITQNTYYHIVALNADPTPTTNFYGIQTLNTGDGAAGATGNNSAGGYQYQSSTNSGGSWTVLGRVFGLVLEYSDGTREGFPYKGVSTLQVYGTRKGGVEIALAANGPHIAFRGVLASVNKTGSPTSIKFSVLRGTGNARTPICTATGSIAGGAISTTRHMVMAWCAEGRVLVAPGDTIAIVGETTNTADSSGNRTNLGIVQFWNQDADLVSPAARLRTILSTDGGSTWTTTADEMAQLSLILDARPLQSISGGFAITQ